MAESKKKKQYLTVGGVFFLLIVIPLSLMAFLIANGMFRLGDTIKARTVNVLDQKSQEEIKMRAINTADEVANFLMERKKDLLVATIIPATEAAYKQFIVENKKPLWVKIDGKIQQVLSPLYKEIALIDKNGNEQIKIVGGQAGKLVNVSNPTNTTYKTEDYFAKTKILNKGDVYVASVTGSYVDKAAFEKGQRFSGIIRFSTPVFSKDGFAGVISLAVDYRHLAKFTDQIIPTQSEHVFEADAKTGNYAFMVDNRGYVISHPNDYHIIGLDNAGNLVPALSEQNVAESTKKGVEVLDLNSLGFMDPNLQNIAKNAAAGKSGIITYKFAGNTKFVAYAPIKFYATNLIQPAGFGWIGMGVEVEKYNEAATKVSQNIQKEAKAWTATVILIIIVSMVILFFIMVLLMRGIGRSIEAEVPQGSEGDLSALNNDDDDDDK
ncbi:MAG: integral membrane sensor signal transduction histidine kinase [Syntrophaceae bacterium]|nr:MAG: integral membrane sensor signal transduction histidine kinase [Syntrophaceae bacterium]